VLVFVFIPIAETTSASAVAAVVVPDQAVVDPVLASASSVTEPAAPPVNEDRPNRRSIVAAENVTVTVVPDASPAGAHALTSAQLTPLDACGETTVHVNGEPLLSATLETVPPKLATTPKIHVPAAAGADVVSARVPRLPAAPIDPRSASFAHAI
jgi:hypothetical protein